MEEKARGLESKKRLTELLEQYSDMLVVATKKKGKYGRYLGIIYAGGKDINQTLITEGYAVEYYGGKR